MLSKLGALDKLDVQVASDGIKWVHPTQYLQFDVSGSAIKIICTRGGKDCERVGVEMQGVECPAGELCQFSRRTATESWDPLAKADDVHAACVGGTPEQIIAAF